MFWFGGWCGFWLRCWLWFQWLAEAETAGVSITRVAAVFFAFKAPFADAALIIWKARAARKVVISAAVDHSGKEGQKEYCRYRIAPDTIRGEPEDK